MLDFPRIFRIETQERWLRYVIGSEFALVLASIMALFHFRQLAARMPRDCGWDAGTPL